MIADNVTASKLEEMARQHHVYRRLGGRRYTDPTMKKLKALANDRGATPAERKTALRMVKKIERRVLLSDGVNIGTRGWDDPANRAYYLMLKREHDANKKKIEAFAKKMMKQSGRDHATSRACRMFIIANIFGGIDDLMEQLNRHLLNREFWEEMR